MKIYLVERYGVYTQGIYGVYDSEEKARAAMLVAEDEEPDDYHKFAIHEGELNEMGFIN